LYRRMHALGLRDVEVAPGSQDPSEPGGTRSSESSTFQ
jgi:hypothetical protein